MATTLLDLPPELIASTFSYLGDGAFFAARASAKQLERASFSTFGKRFFRKKGYMITTDSLDVLQHIASHKELRAYVQHVWLNPDCYTFGPMLFPDGHFDDWDRVDAEDHYSNDPDTNRKNHKAHAACMNDHNHLLQSDRVLAYRLATAFSTLSNLKTVGMRRSDQHSPWGWKRLNDAVGRDPRELGDLPWNHQSGASGPTLLYAAMIKALDMSGAAIQRLYTDAIEIDLIPPHILPSDVIQRACNSLLYLEVNVTKGNPNPNPQPRTDQHETSPLLSHEILRYGSGLIRLLSASPKLRELGLMIFPNRKQSHLMAPPEGWLQSYPYLALIHLAAGTQLHNLRRIKLEKFTTTASTLINLLKPSSSHLTSIKLRDIRLIANNNDNNNSPITDSSPSSSSEVDKPWQSVFTFLTTSCPKLSYLLLNHLSHQTGTIRFVQNLPPPLETNGSTTESVPDMVNFTNYENISVEAGIAHSDPDTEGREKRAVILRAREVVHERVRALVEGHWYGKNTFSYEMDEMVWHTDTSEEEW